VVGCQGDILSIMKTDGARAQLTGWRAPGSGHGRQRQVKTFCQAIALPMSRVQSQEATGCTEQDCLQWVRAMPAGGERV